MSKRDLSNLDAHQRAASELEYVIKTEPRGAGSDVRKITAEEAMTQKRFYQAASSRDVTRVLFISRNSELLNPTRQTLDGYVNLSDLFDEVHVLILRQGIAPRYPVLRVADNVWLYTAAAHIWWWTPFVGLKLIDQELVFATGFRPDLIVARDPFESAVVAFQAAKKYNRTTQLHIIDDFTTNDFLKRSKHNFWRRLLARFTIPRFVSVRTTTSTVLRMLQKRFTIPDVEILPRFQDYQALIDINTYIDLKEKYKPAIFTILYIGKLDHESTLYRAMDAARFVLKNPRVALVVIGDGPARSEFQKRAKTLGIERQVVFETKVTDETAYLKSANMLVVTDVDADSEELVLKGAAAGIPMVISYTEKRADVFTDGESAFLCDTEDVQAFTDRIDDLLNDIDLRQQFVERAQAIIRDEFHRDPAVYKQAYRESVEEAFFAGTDEEVHQERNQSTS